LPLFGSFHSLKATTDGEFGKRPAKAAESKEDVLGRSRGRKMASQLHYE
jgi:hypothetical protein